MSTQLIGVLFISFCAFISLLEGFISARKALKQDDKVMAAFAGVFLICGMVLLLCLNSITS
jgi:hypothetical protein